MSITCFDTQVNMLVAYGEVDWAFFGGYAESFAVR